MVVGMIGLGWDWASVPMSISRMGVGGRTLFQPWGAATTGKGLWCGKPPSLPLQPERSGHDSLFNAELASLAPSTAGATGERRRSEAGSSPDEPSSHTSATDTNSIDRPLAPATHVSRGGSIASLEARGDSPALVEATVPKNDRFRIVRRRSLE
jgi:hypothetical protein